MLVWGRYTWLPRRRMVEASLTRGPKEWMNHGTKDQALSTHGTDLPTQLSYSGQFVPVEVIFMQATGQATRQLRRTRVDGPRRVNADVDLVLERSVQESLESYILG